MSFERWNKLLEETLKKNGKTVEDLAGKGEEVWQAKRNGTPDHSRVEEKRI